MAKPYRKIVSKKRGEKYTHENKYEEFSKVQEAIIDRQCGRKASFETLEEAYQIGQKSYKCPICGKYHRASIVKRRGGANGFSL